MNAQKALWTGGPILLIEDEPSVIAFLARGAGAQGIRGGQCFIGEEGLQRLSMDGTPA